MRVRPLSERLGLVVEPEAGEALAAPEPAAVLALLREAGALLFEGFGAGLPEFESFTRRFGPIVWDTHDVFPGGEPLGFHSEATWTPCPPDVIWLYCVRPAAAGGETKLCDGVRVLAEMDDDLRALFLAKNLQFNKRWSREKWPGRLRVSNLEEADAFLSKLPGVSYSVEADELLHLRFVTSAIRKTKLTGEDAFANSVINTSYYSSFGLRFEDGTEIPTEVMRRLKRLTDSLAVAVRWRPGGFLMVDNSRVMHGRDAYQGTERDIKSVHTNFFKRYVSTG